MNEHLGNRVQLSLNIYCQYTELPAALQASCKSLTPMRCLHAAKVRNAANQPTACQSKPSGSGLSVKSKRKRGDLKCTWFGAHHLKTRKKATMRPATIARKQAANHSRQCAICTPPKQVSKPQKASPSASDSHPSPSAETLNAPGWDAPHLKTR